MKVKLLFSVLVIVIETGERQKKMMKESFLNHIYFAGKKQICVENARTNTCEQTQSPKLKVWREDLLFPKPKKFLLDF